MASSCSWTVLCIGLFSCVFSQSQDRKALLVTTRFSRELHAFRGDPSTFTQDRVVSDDSQMDFSPYSRVISIAPNVAGKSLLVLDASVNTIYDYRNFTLFLNNTQAPDIVHRGVSYTYTQIAYDFLADNVYWTDGYFKWIAMHPLNFDKDMSVYYIVKRKGLTKPEGLALDPYDRLLFYSDIIKDRSVIGVADLAGNNARNIITSKDGNPGRITSLAADTTNKKLYWSDLDRNSIEFSNYDGSKVGSLVKGLQYQFLSLTVADQVVCGAEYYYGEVVCYSKQTKNETWFATFGLYDSPWAVGIHDSARQEIKAHPCQQKTCKHMCINTGPNTAKCACKEGYKLMGDGVSCESKHGLLFGKAVLIANTTNACMLDIHISANHKQDPDCILTNMTNLKFFAVDSHERQFYYVDSSSSSRIVGKDMITDMQSFSLDVNEDITGFTYDWVTRQVYWSEIGGSISKHLIGSLDVAKVVEYEMSPAYVTVDPHLRKLYWLTGTGYQSTLVEMHLGVPNSRKVLISEYTMYSPTSLFYDVTSERLFVNDDAYLASITPPDDSMTYHTYIGDTKSIAVYKDYTYWASDEYLDMASVHSSYYDYDMDVSFMNSIVAVGLYDVDLQPAMKNNCTYNNGGCEEFCEPTGETTYVCSCPFGQQLQPDGKSCSTTPFTDNFCLLPDIKHHQIYQVGLSNGETKVLDIPDVNVPVSVIYDTPTQKVYWTNAVDLEIRSSGLRSDTSDVILNTGRTLPVGLAFDYSSNLLYFTTESWRDPSFIGCFDPQYNMYMTLVRDLDLPKNIALNPKMGWMVFTDISTQTDTKSYIGFAHMDGTNKTKLVEDNVESPNGIVIDFQMKRIYWADPGRNSIESIKFDGTDRKQILVESGAGLVGLDLSPPHLYYVGRYKQHISKYSVYTNTSISFMNDIHAFGRTDTIRCYPEQTQPRNDHCHENKGGCEFFCLPTPSGRTCGCPDGDYLSEDGKDCRNHITCPRKIPNALLDRKCMGHAKGVCGFTCANGYKNTTDKLTCLDTGVWSPSMYGVCETLSGTCPGSFLHGHVASNCGKMVGNTCTYECNVGYIKDTSNMEIQCLPSGAWNKPTENLCKPANVYCPVTIDNGKLETTCTRGSGTECDYTCKSGYMKNKSVRKIVCLSDGNWNFHGPLCVLAPTGKCKQTLANGNFNTGCQFRPQDACSYTCNNGYQKNTIVNELTCMDSGKWNYAEDKLCMKVEASCSLESIKNGQFMTGCSGLSRAKCDYTCGSSFVQQPMALHVICYDGSWSTDPTKLCISQGSPKPGVSSANTQTKDDGASGGTVALIVIIAIVLTVVVVLGLVYVFWWKKRKPQGQYVQNNTNLKFQRFDDSGVQNEGGVTGFSNPIASQPDYGRFGTLREEGYITTEIAPGYDQVDPKDVNVSVNRNSNPYENTDA